MLFFEIFRWNLPFFYRSFDETCPFYFLWLYDEICVIFSHNMLFFDDICIFFLQFLTKTCIFSLILYRNSRFFSACRTKKSKSCRQIFKLISLVQTIVATTDFLCPWLCRCVTMFLPLNKKVATILKKVATYKIDTTGYYWNILVLPFTFISPPIKDIGTVHFKDYD